MSEVRPSGSRVRVALLSGGLCVAFALFGGLLVGEGLGGWFRGLEKPAFLVPLGVFYAVGALYYALFAVLIFRVLTRVNAGRPRAGCLALILAVMLLNELWNFAFFGLRSTLAGFVGIAVFLVPLSALALALIRHERLSAALLAPYYAWVLYDLAWTFALWRLNPA